jgi:maltose O-acetyltransferase
VVTSARNVIVNMLAGAYVTPRSLRSKLLRACGIPVGHGTLIQSNIRFSGLQVSIGGDCYIGFNCVFDASAPIVIGDNVFIAHRVNFVTATHPIADRNHRAGPQIRLPVTVGSGSWLGTDVTVLPGVTIGEGCVVAAGAVVTRDCGPDGLYAGVPARRVRDLP